MDILLVNDEPVQRYRVASLLRKEGYTVKEAEDGIEALNYLEEGHLPRLIITDLYMPRLDGWQLCRYVREKGLKIPILVVSAFFQLKEISEILKALGVDDFLRSPIKKNELLKKVRELLEGGSFLQQENRQPLLFLAPETFSDETLLSHLHRAGFDLFRLTSLKEAQGLLQETGYPLALITSHFSPDDLFSLKQTSLATSFVVLVFKGNHLDPFRYVLKGARHVVPYESSPEFLIYLLQRELKEQALLLGQELLRQKTRELEKVSRELHRVQNVLQTVVEQAADIGIIVTDEKMNPFFANPQAERFFALSPERDFWGFFKVFFGRSDLSLITQAVKERGDFHCEVKVPETGEILSLKVRPLREEGRITGYVFFVADLTEEREIQNRLVQMQKMEAVATLAAGIAHDFNNLLAAIRLKAELLEEKLENGYVSYVKDIMNICDRAAQIVRQIISFSQPAKTHEICDLNQPVREAISFLQETIPRGIRVQVELSSEPLPVQLDPGKLSQIVMNLCLNAVQAMGERGTLTIRTGKDRYQDFEPPGFSPAGNKPLSGEFVWLEVRDTGCGIRPEHLPRIFDPYFTTKQDQAGTGLGLAVTHGLVSQSGGQIRVETVPEEGTTFLIYLPAVEELQIEEILPQPLLVPTNRIRILVIEDEAVIRESLVEFLKGKGYDTYYCENGDQALKFLDQGLKPEVLLVDLNLPGLSGLEIIKRYKERQSNVVVLVSSGYVSREDREALARLGVEKILIKPFSLEYLHENLQEALFGKEIKEKTHVA